MRFSPLQTREKKLSPGVILGNPPYPYPPPPPAEGRKDRDQIAGFPKMPTWENLFPLAQKWPEFAQMWHDCCKDPCTKTCWPKFQYLSWNRDFGPRKSRNQNFCKFLNIFLYFDPINHPTGGGMDPKSFSGGYMKLYPRSIDQLWNPPRQDAAPLSKISSFVKFWHLLAP